MEVQKIKGDLNFQAVSTHQKDDGIRTFVFQKEQTHQSLLLDIKMSLFQETVDLSALFDQYCPLKDHKISIYDPDQNSFVSLAKLGADTNAKVPRNLLETQIVMIRFKKRQEETQNTESDSGIQSGRDDKKDRSKQRTIGESIELVKQWRFLHLSSIKSGNKKISLSEAARAVNVSKKTLDDYYYQLRLGEFYNFDFTNNLNEKVGILRAYVKEFKPDRQMKNKNLRHPKNLKIIENFDIDVPRIICGAVEPISPMVQELKSPSSFKSLPIDDDSFSSFDNKFRNPFLTDVMSSYEDKFFKNFEFMLDDPNDPFLQLNRNFKKKIAEQPSEFFFF